MKPHRNQNLGPTAWATESRIDAKPVPSLDFDPGALTNENEVNAWMPGGKMSTERAKGKCLSLSLAMLEVHWKPKESSANAYNSRQVS